MPEEAVVSDKNTNNRVQCLEPLSQVAGGGGGGCGDDSCESDWRMVSSATECSVRGWVEAEVEPFLEELELRKMVPVLL